MRWWLALLAAGCQFHDGTAARDASRDVMAIADVAKDAALFCLGPAPFIVCLPATPTMPLTLPSGDVDTGDSTTANKCASDLGDVVLVTGTSVCAISATALTLNDVGATGPRPLVFVATETIDVDGYLDASSAATGTGPGASSPLCPDMSMTSGTNSGAGGGGGAGGSFGEMGGNGGNGPVSAPGGIGPPPINPPETTLRGGCAGGPGGAGSTSTKAVAGDGGGAVYLVAGTTITLAGTIDASGGGGRGGDNNKGGGAGGGSGGMIVLAAPTLTYTSGSVFANGGGGGGGSIAGTDGDPASSVGSPALGGPANDAAGSSGADGGYKSVAAGSAAQSSAGGAGGAGGGVGVIRLMDGQTLPGPKVSPAPS